MRVCGLKPIKLFSMSTNLSSHPMRVCGLKLRLVCGVLVIFFTPHAGVWIETNLAIFKVIPRPSHPMRVCGLKHTL